MNSLYQRTTGEPGAAVIPLVQTYKATFLNAVVVDTVGTEVVVAAYRTHIFHIIASGITVGGATVTLESSLNSGTNYAEVYTQDIAANGVIEVRLSGLYDLLRATVSSRVGGTYSVIYLGGN